MRKLVVAAMVLTLGLTACGSDSNSNDSSSGTTTKAASSGPPVQLSGNVTDKGTKDATGKSSFEVEVDDFYFNPTFIKATPGQKLSLEVKNEGKASHTFTSTELGIDKELKAGETATIDITVPNADATVFFCRFHQGSGMRGAVYTKEGASASGSSATTVASGNGY
jgi:plastocyanin